MPNNALPTMAPAVHAAAARSVGNEAMERLNAAAAAAVVKNQLQHLQGRRASFRTHEFYSMCWAKVVNRRMYPF